MVSELSELSELTGPAFSHLRTDEARIRRTQAISTAVRIESSQPVNSCPGLLAIGRKLSRIERMPASIVVNDTKASGTSVARAARVRPPFQMTVVPTHR